MSKQAEIVRNLLIMSLLAFTATACGIQQAADHNYIMKQKKAETPTVAHMESEPTD